MAAPHLDGTFTFGDPAGRLTDVKRRESLRNTGLLTTVSSSTLDAITRLAAQTTGAGKARVSLVEPGRQVFASSVGRESSPGEPRATPLSHSLCQYVVANDAVLAVGDARTHPVLCDHPAVVDDGLVAYAGHPLHDPDGRVLGALCVIDVEPRRWTEQHLASLRDLAVAVETEIALRLSRRQTRLDHERLLRVLDGAANTVVIIADADEVVTTMNRTAGLLLGDDAPTVVGRWTLTDLARTARPTGPRAAPGEARDWMLTQSTGEERILSVRISTLCDVDDEVEGYVLVGDDVSVRREAEEVLRVTARRQADVVARLESLDAERNAFIATASHELRTPVTSILGYTEMLVDGAVGELTAAQHHVVDRVDRNSRRLLHLVEDLLSLGSDHLGPGRVGVGAEIEVGALARRAREAIDPQLAGRHLETAVEVAPGCPPITGDPVQLERALQHVLSNAVKFTPDGGSVRLAARPHGTGVVLEVVDTGVGIAEADLGAVFEPFFRTRTAQARAVPGSGVGLAIVRRIVEGHGGEISLDSRVGRGTTVRIALGVGRVGLEPTTQGL